MNFLHKSAFDNSFVSSVLTFVALLSLIAASRAKLKPIELILETLFVNVCLGAFRAIKRDYTNHIRPPFPILEHGCDIIGKLNEFLAKFYDILGYTDPKISVCYLLKLFLILSFISLYGEIPTASILVFYPYIKKLSLKLVKYYSSGTKKMFNQAHVFIKSLISRYEWKHPQRMKV